MNVKEKIIRKKPFETTTSKIVFILVALFLLLIFSLFSLFVGPSNMSIGEGFKALFYLSSETNNKIIHQVRIPEILAGIIAGAGLSLSGLIMQTVLKNPLASPSTLGVSNAAVFGANIAIIGISGGVLSANINPFATSSIALVISLISVVLILGLSSLKSFSPGTVVLGGIAIGTIWTALTTILQFYATDTGLSSAVIWSFGDLSRATNLTNIISGSIVLAGAIFFFALSWKFNTLLSGDEIAKANGINVKVLRLISLFVASLITSVIVSFVGIIGFIGIICPHIMKRILGSDHRFLIPSSFLSGSILLVLASTLSRAIGNGNALPVGAITSILGVPFFLFIIFSKKEQKL